MWLFRIKIRYDAADAKVRVYPYVGNQGSFKEFVGKLRRGQIAKNMKQDYFNTMKRSKTVCLSVINFALLLKS
uniref:Uncharacterized protein n=1 Tax=Candidatus Kentrum sp. LPFa TaxID=2126335 RepID=A0A450WAT6_9GAMM|nr:MAG: hypothetical protein BECKLPF1236A_GA0070988_101009 [Candidatus Kentron sp. LPFa]VFK29848.1 MAG: hypothetical protein BECKLPF1236C_GA0070990_100969 [Candidatus Kentron sp. LPFa]